VHAVSPQYGALTAQNRRSLLDDTGFSFLNCRVIGSGALYLGRAWGTFSRVVFAYTYMQWRTYQGGKQGRPPRVSQRGAGHRSSAICI
jgi:hypothetical protein